MRQPSPGRNRKAAPPCCGRWSELLRPRNGWLSWGRVSRNPAEQAPGSAGSQRLLPLAHQGCQARSEGGELPAGPDRPQRASIAPPSLGGLVVFRPPCTALFVAARNLPGGANRQQGSPAPAFEGEQEKLPAPLLRIRPPGHWMPPPTEIEVSSVARAMWITLLNPLRGY